MRKSCASLLYEEELWGLSYEKELRKSLLYEEELWGLLYEEELCKSVVRGRAMGSVV